MAKPKRKAPPSKPITQHQLFPAVVALWFGALFGLGSLAVRPTLLEELVIKSRIDLLIPAAAPPLGMTARMLVALIMAALGAMIGTVFARYLARPKPMARERKRTNLSTRDEGIGGRPRDGHVAVSAPGPLSVGEAMGVGETGIPATAQGNRRRSLAIEHEDGAFVPHELAPLPGGSPQIFDIAAVGLSESAPAELVGYGQIVEPHAEPAPVSLDWTNAAPVLPPSAAQVAPGLPQPITMQRQMFQADEPAPAIDAGTELPQLQPGDNRQVFGMAPPAQPVTEQPRQIFGAPISDDHVPKEFVEQQGFKTSVFDVPTPDPLFAPRADNQAAPNAEQATDLAESIELTPAMPPQPEFEAPVEPAFVAPAMPESPAATAAPAVSEAPLPSPATLGMEDLSARLAESMRRRRAARAAGAESGHSAVVAPEAVADAASAQPAVVEAPARPEAQTQSDFAVPQAYEPEPVPAFTVPSFTVPEPEQAATVPQAPPEIPAALRPLDLTGFEESDSLETDSLLPPRHIAMPPEAPVVSPAVQVAQFTAAPEIEEPEATEEANVAEDNYASLIGMSPAQRNPFVRIEESEAEIATIEPVVIFPGQTAHPAASFAAPAISQEAVPFRRFDAPANAGSGQPVAASDGATAIPAEEAEVALRAALANLQRMSGAA